MSGNGITWTDVRATIPQPLEAHAATLGERQVEARLDLIPADPMPYRVTIRLLDAGQPIETWTNLHAIGRGLNNAYTAYAAGRLTAEKFLEGQETRPGRTWTVTKHGAP